MPARVGRDMCEEHQRTDLSVSARSMVRIKENVRPAREEGDGLYRKGSFVEHSSGYRFRGSRKLRDPTGIERGRVLGPAPP
jgi:hypothetical protein